MTLLDNLSQKPVIFVGGKGGVGKTTVAAALAVRFASQNLSTLVISTDPAHSLGDVFDQPLSHEKRNVSNNLDAIELDPHTIIHHHFQLVEQTLKGYTKPEMMPKMREFLQLSHHAPGAEEAAMLEALCRHLLQARTEGYDRVIFDTAPTGHTLRLLTLPEMMKAWTDGLLSMQRRQNKFQTAAQALDKPRQLDVFAPGVEDRWRAAVEALENRRHLFAETRDILHDPTKTAILLVLIPESLPLLETQRAVKQLQQSDLPIAGLIVNKVISENQQDPFWLQRFQRQQDILYKIDDTLSTLTRHNLSLRPCDIRGVDALAQLF